MNTGVGKENAAETMAKTEKASETVENLNEKTKDNLLLPCTASIRLCDILSLSALRGTCS